MIRIPYGFEVNEVNLPAVGSITLAFMLILHIKHFKLIQSIIFCYVRGSVSIMLQVQN